jgi:hypothetical protein
MTKQTTPTLRGHTVVVEDMLDAGKLIAKRLGHSPRAIEYKLERADVQRDAATRGKLLLLPSYASIHRLFPVWDDFLRAAKLRPLGGRRTSGSHGGGRKVTATADVCMNAINLARAALGDPLTATDYVRWRARQLRLTPSLTYVLPSLASIYRRFPSWNTAVLAAIGARTDMNSDERRTSGE